MYSEGGLTMRSKERFRNRRGKNPFFQNIMILFLVGFFIGAIFYYLFQNSFAELFQSMENSFVQWKTQETVSWWDFLAIMWNHGKYFGLMWILSGSKVSHWFERIFTIYTGLRNGFLMMFFLFSRGFMGIVLYFVSLMPQGVLFAPLYLFSFLYIREKRQVKRQTTIYIVLALTFLTACLFEFKFNCSWMKSLL